MDNSFPTKAKGLAFQHRVGGGGTLCRRYPELCHVLADDEWMVDSSYLCAADAIHSTQILTSGSTIRVEFNIFNTNDGLKCYLDGKLVEEQCMCEIELEALHIRCDNCPCKNDVTPRPSLASPTPTPSCRLLADLLATDKCSCLHNLSVLGYSPLVLRKVSKGEHHLRILPNGCEETDLLHGRNITFSVH